jgi:hypothetical protein
VATPRRLAHLRSERIWDQGRVNKTLIADIDSQLT